MAIQAQLYPENLGLPLMGGGGGLGGGAVSQDWLFMANNQNNIISNNNNNSNLYVNGCGLNEFTTSNNNNNNLQQQKQQQQFQFQQQQQQQQQEALLQLQQQYLLQLQQQQQRSSCENNNNNIINHNNNNNNNNNDGFAFLSTSKNRATTTTTATTASTTTTGSDYQHMPINSFSPSFADQLEKQRQEIDRFITLQNERLKLALQEQRKQQLANMMRKLEAKAMQLLRQKDDEIARAGKRTMELEEIIRKMEVENQEWQRLAAENEAMVVSLSNTIEQIKEQGGCCITSSSTSSNEVGDAESCCNFNNNNDESYSSKKRGREEMNQVITEVEDKKRVKTEVLCKVCKTGNSCVLLLPCRHLCCCKDCEAFVDVCPVCKSAKMASIEALFS